MNTLKTVGLTVSILAGFTLTACGALYDPMATATRGDTLELVGVIDADTKETIAAAHAANPTITKLSLLEIPGSVDDENSLTELASYIRDNNLTTIVPSHGMVASGGTDMAVMGRNRIIEDGACVGVHSWAAAALGGLLGVEAGADLPRDHESHKAYLDFYEETGVPSDFYWFTLEAAPPEDVHWMSPAEINRFKLSQIPLDENVAETDAERRFRCNNAV